MGTEKKGAKMKRTYQYKAGDKTVEREYNYEYKAENEAVLKEDDAIAASQARMLTDISGSKLFTNTEIRYFPLGEEMYSSMLPDLERAEKFIFMEYFIIEEGRFWNSILDILKRKAKEGVTVRVRYIGTE